MRSSKTIDEYFSSQTEWVEEQRLLRDIMLTTGLTETIKWGGPVYTLDGKNLVGLGGFKSYFGLWFFQGALLADKSRRLVNAQERVTAAQRQLRFGSSDKIDRKVILDYVAEAIANHRAGRSIKPVSKPLVVPPELEAVFAAEPDLKAMFESLGLTKQRDFCEFVETAKMADTKLRRIEKIVPMIRSGIGLNDRYK